MKNFLLLGVFLSLGATLVACQDEPVKPTKNSANVDFVGCYVLEKGVPAQIKITKTNDQYTMQMKEDSEKVWDTAEPLTLAGVSDGFVHFNANALNVNANDVAEILVRPDGVMALAQLKPAVANINPHLDSDVVMSILGAVNTVYKVACDDVPLDLMPTHDFHHSPTTK